jgi:hypothetical protein
MNKLLLTIDLDVNDNELNYLTDIRKINYGQIVDKTKPIFNTPEELINLRMQLLIQEINESNSDLLIGFAINEPEHLTNLVSAINSSNFKITEIFLDNGKRRIQKQKEYEEDYKLHSRWLGYTPEEVKKMNDNYYETIDLLLTQAKYLNIICTYI